MLEESAVESDELRSVLSTLREEAEIREKASAAVAGSFSARHPSLREVRLPYVETPEPRDIVLQLSRQLDVMQLLAV